MIVGLIGCQMGALERFMFAAILERFTAKDNRQRLWISFNWSEDDSVQHPFRAWCAYFSCPGWRPLGCRFNIYTEVLTSEVYQLNPFWMTSRKAQWVPMLVNELGVSAVVCWLAGSQPAGL